MLKKWATAKLLTSGLVLSFLQHNLHLVVLECCLHLVVMRFMEIKRPQYTEYSQDKFQICCIDMYLIRFLANLAAFRRFTWISRLHNSEKYQKLCFLDIYYKASFGSWTLVLTVIYLWKVWTQESFQKLFIS